MAIDGASDVTVEISITGKTGMKSSFTEKYFVKDGVLTIHALDELLQPFFDFSDDVRVADVVTERGAQYIDPYIKLELKVEANGTTKAASFEVAYANVEMEGAELPYPLFLTRCPDTQDLPTDGIGVVNFWSMENRKLRISIAYSYNNSGHVHEEEMNTKVMVIQGPQGTVSQKQVFLGSYTFIWQDILDMVVDVAPGITMDEVRYVTFALVDNGKVTDESTFIRQDSFQSAKIALIGPLGEIEFLNMHGQRGRSSEFTPTLLTVDDKFRKVDTDFAVNFEARTGAIETWQRDLVYDMAVAKEVWAFRDGQLVPITITNINIDEKEPHTAPIALAVKYRIAGDRVQRVFSREPHVGNHRVFTTEFNEVFS